MGRRLVSGWRHGSSAHDGAGATRGGRWVNTSDRACDDDGRVDTATSLRKDERPQAERAHGNEATQL